MKTKKNLDTLRMDWFQKYRARVDISNPEFFKSAKVSWDTEGDFVRIVSSTTLRKAIDEAMVITNRKG
jgi:hypothetical protein